MDLIEIDSSRIVAEYNKLRNHHSNFPPILKDFQIRATLSLILGKDVLLLTATSTGKTLPYILAPLIKAALCNETSPTSIVVLPLDALMLDIHRRIHELGFNCSIYTKGTFDASTFETDMRTSIGPTYLLFSPETFAVQGALKAIFQTAKPSFIVLDEAHVVSSWGCGTQKNPAFRAAYGNLSVLRSYTKAPLFCATATSTKSMVNTIIQKCGLIRDNLDIISRSPDRPNIFLSLLPGKKDYEKLIFLVNELKSGSLEKTLIFCDSYNEANEVFYFLWEHLDDSLKLRKEESTGLIMPNLMIHSGASTKESKAWISANFCQSSNCKILVSTISFGMGIDVANIRRTIIWGMPTDAVSLWQEIGRTGRDNLPSLATIYSFKSSFYISKKSLYKIEESSCFRKQIINSFYYNRNEITHNVNLCNHRCVGSCACSLCVCCDFCSSQCACESISM